MTIASFSDFVDPVAKLLSYGECQDMNYQKLADYGKEFGITTEHIPELIQLALTRNNPQFKPQKLEAWGAVHAWRVLAQLEAKAAIVPLLDLFDRSTTDEWVDEEMPQVYAAIVLKHEDEVFTALSGYLADTSNSDHGRVTAMECFLAIGQKHLTLNDKSIAALTTQLEKYKQNSIDLNSYLVDDLIQLAAESAAPVVKKAYDAGRVDPIVVGDWEELEYAFGLKEPPPMSEEDKFHIRGILDSLEKLTGAGGSDRPLSDEEMMRMAGEYNPAMMPGGMSKSQKSAKQKTKNKLAKQSRQKNRAKKKKKKKK
ncbi:hypothetical protein Pse7367_2971 [Thalassoporum mexicanum PCC 7367]|uniref:hypothetical protein n=1 Tax=Thalassoporum mexicanum TaxID=3457544 RepID=UPI00029F8920|nr:hypothetical protein [Pseudanabaena sp. PCC 7367]AFY71222.1 hypothetical protein Pse7367_2971 [Pseudanabaena sp. PCC 7367]